VEDFLTALQHAVKEEIVENYFHERRIIEEEAAEVEAVRGQAAAAAEDLALALGRLGLVLLEERFVKDFWRRAGLGAAPPVQPAAPAAGGQLLGRGWRWRRRYRDLVEGAAEGVSRAAGRHGELLAWLRRLVDEVNADIDRFHQNNDFLALVSVLNQMDPELIQKKYFLGSDLEGQVCGSLDEGLRFRKLARPGEGAEPLPGLPPPADLRRAARAEATAVLRALGPEVRRRLAGPD